MGLAEWMVCYASRVCMHLYLQRSLLHYERVHKDECSFFQRMVQICADIIFICIYIKYAAGSRHYTLFFITMAVRQEQMIILNGCHVWFWYEFCLIEIIAAFAGHMKIVRLGKSNGCMNHLEMKQSVPLCKACLYIYIFPKPKPKSKPKPTTLQ